MISDFKYVDIVLYIVSQAANALTYDELQGLTYLQVKGTGVANTCPVIEQGSSDVKVRSLGPLSLSSASRAHHDPTTRPVGPQVWKLQAGEVLPRAHLFHRQGRVVVQGRRERVCQDQAHDSPHLHPRCGESPHPPTLIPDLNTNPLVVASTPPIDRSRPISRSEATDPSSSRRLTGSTTPP